MQYNNLGQTNNKEAVEVPINYIDVQTAIKFRHSYAEDKELTANIMLHGQINPISLRKKNHSYQIIDGLMRIISLKNLGHKNVKAIVYEYGQE